ncbi:MAG: phytoene desaturase family protein [Pirellulaceae bacterium]|nr:phytoene desaturase family protein [Pirellulaceae bacterium]
MKWWSEGEQVARSLSSESVGIHGWSNVSQVKDNYGPSIRMSKPMVTIIGAGPGGLAAAMQLAHAGARVKILERMPRVGGRCSAIESDGFRFDVGPTFFLYPRVLAEIFSSVGRDLWSEVPMTRLDPQYRVAFGAGGKIDATPDIARMEKEIAGICPQDATSFVRFMTDNREKLARFRPILESPFNSAVDLMRPSMLKALPMLKPWRSVGGELQKYFSDPRLVVAFSFQSKYLGMSPFQCPSLFSILAFLEYEYGIYHPTGGCCRVSERMAEIAQEMGVEIHLNEPVEEILFSGRKAVGIRTDQAEYATDALVVNADFSRAMHRLVPDHLRPRWTDQKLTGKKFSCSTFMMYLGVEGRFDNLPHHTIHIAEDYEGNLQDIEQRHVLSEDPSFYVQNACVTDSSLAPQGMSTLYVLAPVTHMHANVDWNQEREQFRNRIVRQLEKVGVTDLERRIRFEQVVTPADWDSGHEIHLGATFNLAHNLGQMLHRRPHNRFEDLGSVYLVGGGTHPGSGLPVIYESSRITSNLIRSDLSLSETVRQPTRKRAA